MEAGVRMNDQDSLKRGAVHGSQGLKQVDGHNHLPLHPSPQLGVTISFLTDQETHQDIHPETGDHQPGGGPQ